MSKTSIRPNLILGLPERSGFLLPSLTIWTSVVVYLVARKEEKGINYLLTILESKPLISIIGLTLIAVYTIFILGHIIDLLSNALNERFLANKMNGYPHERIVPHQFTTNSYKLHEMRKKTSIGRASFFFEGAKLLIAASSLYFFVRILERHPKIKTIESAPTVLDYIQTYAELSIVLAIALGLPSFAVRFFPAYDREQRTKIAQNFIVKIKRLIRKNKLLTLTESVWNVLRYVVFGPLIYSYDVADSFIVKSIRISTGIDPTTFEKCRSAFKKITGNEFLAIQNNDRFWLIYLIIHNKLPHMVGKIDQIKKFSGFCRNQSFACFVSALIISGVYRDDAIGSVGFFSRNNMCSLSIALFLFAWLFHWKFLHHYHSYTKMIFRSLALLDKAAAKNIQGS